MNSIWTLDERFTNHLLAQQKLIERRREGSKIVKRHDRAQTPVERTIASGVLSPAKAGALRRQTGQIRPAQLSRAIARLTAELGQVALDKTASPLPRAVNRSFVFIPHPEVSDESTNRRSRRI